MKNNPLSIIEFLNSFNLALIEHLVTLNLDDERIKLVNKVEQSKKAPFIEPAIIIDFLENRQFN